MKNSPGLPFALIAAAVTLLPGLSVSESSSTTTSRTEETVLACQIGKWQTIYLRKGKQWPVYHYDNSFYYALDLVENTRDRDGQGIFAYSTTRLLHCFGKDVKVVRKTDSELNLELHFERSQGPPEKSIVRFEVKEQPGVHEGDDPTYSVRISGEGIVFDGFYPGLKETLENSDWVPTIEEMTWEYFPEIDLTPPAPQYDREKVLKSIGAAYQRMTGGEADRGRTIVFECPNDPMGGEITIREFISGDASVDISYTAGDHGWGDQSFYFEDGRLIFALDGEGSWRFGEGKNAQGQPSTIDNLRERRYYYHVGHCVRVLEKSASVKDGGDLQKAIDRAKNKELTPSETAREIYDRGYMLLNLPNATAAIDYFCDGVASEMIDKARKLAEKQVPDFDHINARGVIGDLDGDGETDVTLLGGGEKWQVLAILGPLQDGAKTSLVAFDPVPNQDPPNFEIESTNYDLAEALGENPEGFQKSDFAKGVRLEIEHETDSLHLYWNHKRGGLSFWRL